MTSPGLADTYVDNHNDLPQPSPAEILEEAHEIALEAA